MKLTPTQLVIRMLGVLQCDCSVILLLSLRIPSTHLRAKLQRLSKYKYLSSSTWQAGHVGKFTKIINCWCGT
jgi:hypothetical protein